MTHLRADPALTVGSTVSASTSKIGTVDRPLGRRAPRARAVHPRRGELRRARSSTRRARSRSAELLRLLFLADVFGSPGRRAVEERLPALREELGVDFCVVNGENAADGRGLTPKLADKLLAAGADVITLGNHVWARDEIGPYLAQSERVIRPANVAAGSPGRALAVAPAARRNAGRGGQPDGLALPRRAGRPVRGARRARRRGPRAGEGRRRRLPRRGDEREGRGRALARRHASRR